MPGRNHPRCVFLPHVFDLPLSGDSPLSLRHQLDKGVLLVLSKENARGGSEESECLVGPSVRTKQIRLNRGGRREEEKTFFSNAKKGLQIADLNLLVSDFGLGLHVLLFSHRFAPPLPPPPSVLEWFRLVAAVRILRVFHLEVYLDGVCSHRNRRRQQHVHRLQ